MKRNQRKYVTLGLLLAMLCVLLLPIAGASAKTATAKSGQYVYDDAGLLTSGEIEKLEQKLQKKGNELGIGIYVLTSYSTEGHHDKYIEDFYDLGYDEGTIEKNSVYVHLNMATRYCSVQAYGTAQSKIGDTEADSIYVSMVEDLKQDEYYEAFETYLDRVEYYINYVPIWQRWWVQLLAAMAIGGITVGIMAVNSGGKMTVTGKDYADAKHTGVRASRDDYIRTTVTKHRKSSSSGGGGHSSGGGHSHSSGGGHF